jgi:hypothetical protein
MKRGRETQAKISAAHFHQQQFREQILFHVSAKGRVEEKRSKTFAITIFTEIIGRKGTAADLKAVCESRNVWTAEGVDGNAEAFKRGHD